MEGRAPSQEPPAREKLWRWQELWVWVSWLLFPRLLLSLCDLVHVKKLNQTKKTTKKPRHHHQNILPVCGIGRIVFISPRLVNLCFGDFSSSHLILLLVVQKERPLCASTSTFGQSGFSLRRKACLWDLSIFPDVREFVWLFSFLYALFFFTSFTLTNSISLLFIKHSHCRSLIFPVSTPSLPSGYQMLLSRSVLETCVSVTTRGCSVRFLPLLSAAREADIAEVLLKQTLFWPHTCLSLLPPCSARRNI